MAFDVYVSVDGKARRAKALYIGVNGVARKVKKAYIGVASALPPQSGQSFFYSGDALPLPLSNDTARKVKEG